MITVKFKKLDEHAVIPKRAHKGDVGMDMTAISFTYDAEHDMYIYHTGLACETEEGYGIFGFPRSSNCKTEAYLTNSVGIIDSATYRGEIQFRYKNRKPTDWNYINCLISNIRTSGESLDEDEISKLKENFINSQAPYKAGDRIGQIVVMPIPEVEVIETETLSDTERGNGGFGSTGK